MNKLKRKVFFTLFSILTISLLGFISVFNIRNYIEQKKLINDNLTLAINNEKEKQKRKEIINNEKETPKEDPKINEQKELENIKFMDKTIYVVLLNNNNDIVDIVNLSNNNINKSYINSIANQILNSNNLSNQHVGFLYFENYSYAYNEGEFLVILDNASVKSNLLKSLNISIILFILLELLIIIITRIITSWIIKPVLSSFEKQKQFIADASHELKTPLSVIIASSEALEENINEKKWLTNIKSEASRMNILINDLLELASSENKEMYKLKEGNLSKVVELSVLTFEGKAFESNIKLEYNIKADINTNFDENSIKQLIEILLDNAIKHSKEKSTINIKLSEENSEIILIVTNTGDEIPLGEEEKIFERFYRADKSRNRKENRYGLGLAIAKNIVEIHNGKITAKSSDGHTTFKVLLKK